MHHVIFTYLYCYFCSVCPGVGRGGGLYCTHRSIRLRLRKRTVLRLFHSVKGICTDCSSETGATERNKLAHNVG